MWRDEKNKNKQKQRELRQNTNNLQEESSEEVGVHVLEHLLRARGLLGSEGVVHGQGGHQSLQ